MSMMMQAGLKVQRDIRLAPDVIMFLADDGTARLVDLDREIYALPSIATEMLTLSLDNGPKAAAEHIAKLYEVPLDRVSRDLDALFNDLSRRDLICKPHSQTRRRRIRRALAAVTISPILRALAHLDFTQRGRLAPLLFLARASIAVFGFGSSIGAWGKTVLKCSKACRLPHEQILRLDEAVRAASSQLPGLACKERALTFWFVLCVLGVPSDLVVGLQIFPTGGHTWCEVEGEIFTDSSEHCHRYHEIARFSTSAHHHSPAPI